jgi:hypothetical protein
VNAMSVSLLLHLLQGNQTRLTIESGVWKRPTAIVPLAHHRVFIGRGKTAQQYSARLQKILRQREWMNLVTQRLPASRGHEDEAVPFLHITGFIQILSLSRQWQGCRSRLHNHGTGLLYQLYIDQKN